MHLLLKWLINALGLMAVAYLYPGVHVAGFVAALVAALVLGLINAVIRPVLILLTLPINILTLGLFTFVINALLFWLVAEILQGFTVDGFVPALIGSILYSLITMAASWLVVPRAEK